MSVRDVTDNTLCTLLAIVALYAALNILKHLFFPVLMSAVNNGASTRDTILLWVLVATTSLAILSTAAYVLLLWLQGRSRLCLHLGRRWRLIAALTVPMLPAIVGAVAAWVLFGRAYFAAT